METARNLLARTFIRAMRFKANSEIFEFHLFILNKMAAQYLYDSEAQKEAAVRLLLLSRGQLAFLSHPDLRERRIEIWEWAFGSSRIDERALHMVVQRLGQNMGDYPGQGVALTRGRVAQINWNGRHLRGRFGNST